MNPSPSQPSERPTREGPLQALRTPYFRAVWLSNLLQFFGTQVQLFTLQWLVTDMTTSRTLIGLVTSVQGATVALASPAAGVAADRLPKRNLLILGRLGVCIGVLVMTSLAYAGVISLTHVFAFSFSYILVVEFASGLCAQLWQISAFSGLQLAVRENMRGRVMGILFTVVQLAQVGGVFVGGLADQVGDQLTMGIFGATPVVFLLGLLAFGHRTLGALGALGADTSAESTVAPESP